MKYFLIVSLSLLFVSCSKNNSSSTQTSYDSTCQIVNLKWVQQGTDSSITNLSYNSAGKLSKTEDGLGNTTIYTYSGNQIFISTSGNPAYYDTTTLNNFGYITQFDVNSDPLIFTSSFFYTSDTVLSYLIFISPLIAAPDTSHYYFKDGDLTGTVPGTTTPSYTYYTDKSEQPADLYIYNQMVDKGALAYKNKHLIKSYLSNSISEEYTYTFDGSGKILTITDHYVNSQSSGTIIYYYTYACHL